MAINYDAVCPHCNDIQCSCEAYAAEQAQAAEDAAYAAFWALNGFSPYSSPMPDDAVAIVNNEPVYTIASIPV